MKKIGGCGIMKVVVLPSSSEGSRFCGFAGYFNRISVSNLSFMVINPCSFVIL